MKNYKNKKKREKILSLSVMLIYDNIILCIIYNTNYYMI